MSARGILADIMQLYMCVHAPDHGNTALLLQQQYHFLRLESLSVRDTLCEILSTDKLTPVIYLPRQKSDTNWYMDVKRLPVTG